MSMTRRDVLKTLGVGTLALVGGQIVTTKSLSQAASAAEDEKWRQFAGSKLIFLSEDTPPTLAVKAKIQPFTELTGIEIEIIPEYLDIVAEKLRIEREIKEGAFALYYNQDKPIGAPFFDMAEDLRQFEQDPTLPTLPEGVGAEVWGYRWLDVCGRYFGREQVISYPYDNAIAVMMYRQDLFEKYSPQFEQEYGRPLVYTDRTTWKDVLDICAFFKNADFPDVKYGLALQGKKGWAGHLDYQRFSYSHGQWLEWDFDDWFGSDAPGPCNWGDEQSVLTMTRYKDLMNAAHPDSLHLDWATVDEAYRTGLIAMCPNYGEFAAGVEDPRTSKAAGGRTAYALCPKGEPSWIVNGGQAVNGTNYGIGGIAINRNVAPELKKAAYLFILWVTSHDTQYQVLKDVGGTPTRMSVFELDDVKAAFNRETAPMKAIDPVEMEPGVVVNDVPLMPNALTYGPSLIDVRPPNIAVGPKIPTFNEYIMLYNSEIHKCVSGLQSPEEACRAIKTKTDRLHGLG